MNVSQMAWRNLWRSKRRTLITAFSIGLGLMLAVTFTGIGDYMYTNMIDTSATMGFGHVTVEPTGYHQTPTLDKRLRDSVRIREKILTIPGVADAVIRIMGQAMFASANKTIGGSFLAVDPAQESPEYNLLYRSLIEGTLFTDADGRGIVVGSKMAKKLHLKIGKKVVYTTTDVHGEIVSELARVSGIFSAGLDEVDGGMVLLPLNRVRSTLNYDTADATMISVIIDDQRDAESIQEQISKSIDAPDAEVLNWRQTQSDMAGLITLDRSANYLSQVLVGCLIAAGILNTLLMSVLQRTREFGVMMAVGMSPRTLFKLIFMESFWLALVGIILGLFITAPWYAYLANVGLDFSGVIGDNYSASGVLVDPLIRIRLFKESIFAIVAGVFALTLLSGLYPAYRAVRTPPVESLKTM